MVLTIKSSFTWASALKEPIRVQKRTSFLFAICCGLSCSTHEPNSLIFYTSKLKRGSCPTRAWVEYEYFSYFLPAKQKKSNMGRSYTHKNHQLIFISNWLNSAFSRIQERFLLCNKTVSLYLRKCLVWSTLFYVLLNIVYFPRVCDTNLSVWKKKEPPNEWFQCHWVNYGRAPNHWKAWMEMWVNQHVAGCALSEIEMCLCSSIY